MAAVLKLSRMPPREFPRRMSIAQYMAMPDDGNKYELFDSELVISPSYFYPHGVVTGYVFGLLREHVAKKKLGYVALDTDVVMARQHSVLRPDICFIAAARRSIIRGHIHGAPDLVIEVTSPGNWQNDVHFKRLKYDRIGVREYWVLDIADGRNLAYRWWLQQGALTGGLIGTSHLRSRIIAGFSVRLRDVWNVAREPELRRNCPTL